MWFKQAQIFCLSDVHVYTAEQIESELAALSFTACLPSLPSAHGWVPPVMATDDAPMTHVANRCILFCLQIEEKILPPSVIRQEVNTKVKQIQQREERKVSQKEKRRLQDEMIQTLLPRAFSKLSHIYAYIDIDNEWLVIDTTIESKVELFTGFLNRTLPKLKLNPFFTKSIAPTLTHWLSAPHKLKAFDIDKACVLKDPQQQSRVIRCQHQDLTAEAILSLIKDGCQINQLALNWHDEVSFSLNEQCALKSIRYHDAVLEMAKSDYTESEAQRFDADFIIMLETLRGILRHLKELLAEKKKERAPAELEV